MSGNYDRTEFSSYTENDYIKCGFHVSDKEMKLIKTNNEGITNEMIKEAVLNVFRNNKKNKFNRKV